MADIHSQPGTDEAVQHQMARLRATDAELCANPELEGIFRALDGRFIRPEEVGVALR